MIKKYIDEYPLVSKLANLEEVFYLNEQYEKENLDENAIKFESKYVIDAMERLERFAPYIKKTFKDSEKLNGIIESELLSAEKTKDSIEKIFKLENHLSGNLYLKLDSHLAISGSIKARGGIYEILKYAETLAIENDLIKIEDNYEKFSDDIFKDLFSKYSIHVGSTGNLGLSIGIISAVLGFKVNVHMSRDAKEWKKELLRSYGVNVHEYDDDFSKAVSEGRKKAMLEENSYFVDDENSRDLFFAYAVAAFRLEKQLKEKNIKVDKENPLFVYLPCGVGGGPGGVCFGLKLVFGENVHCFFAEPTHSPAMLLGILTQKHDEISVQDIGLDNKTVADGLAVGRPSKLVGRTVNNLISGLYTVEDDRLFELLTIVKDSEEINLEPSALAGLYGYIKILNSEEGKDYLEKHCPNNNLDKINHIVWATGGSMVPDDEMNFYINKGRELLKLKS